MRAALCTGMTLPAAFERLFSWIEARGHFVDTAKGRVGCLSMQNGAHRAGTYIEFGPQGNASLEHWFGTSNPTVIGRLSVFARTGRDGSMAAFWLNDAGTQKIVHLGSGSGSTTVCILADDPVDFLRLLAIGYDEICWGGEYAEPPIRDGQGKETQNRLFSAWVEKTFNVTVPDCGAEIVPQPASMTHTASDDPFWQWVQKSIAYK